MKRTLTASLLAVALTALLGGCASDPYAYRDRDYGYYRGPEYRDYHRDYDRNYDRNGFTSRYGFGDQGH